MNQRDNSTKDVGKESAALPVARILPAYTQVAAQLRDLVVRGVLVPGQRLPSEERLGENFGISRNTLREALRSLASEGLLETRRGVNGGTFIAQPDRDVVQAHLEVGIGLLTGAKGISPEEIFETRMILELPAARNAALRRSPEDIARIRSAATAVEHGGAHTIRTTGSVDFHQAVMDAAGNRLLSTIAPPVWRAFASCALERSAQTSIWKEIDHDHAEIADCIEHHDPDGAEAAMRRHLEQLRDHQM